MEISIHALLAESDHPLLSGTAQHTYFYPRSPCGERLTLIWDVIAVITISIHALLAESDTCFQLWSPPLQHFYPRSPCGERLCGCELKVRSCRFLSTLSLRRATLFLRSGPMTRPYFYPRSPCGERLLIDLVDSPVAKISIHALLAESDSLWLELV